jgi:FkbM family methyltransferase
LGNFFLKEEMPPMRQPPAMQPGRVLIFGAGCMGREIAARLRKADIPVHGFLDKNPRLRSGKIAGLPVFDPERLLDAGDAAVILASISAQAMRERCLQFGVGDIVSLAEAVRRFNLFHAFHEIESNAAAEAALKLWEDESSRAVYRSLVRFRASLDLSGLPPLAKDPYFPPDIVGPKDLYALADCGAYTGDSYQRYRRRAGAAYGRYYGFEPDPAIFRILAANVGDDPQARLYDCAVGDKTGDAHFYALQTGNSNISEEGSSVVKLDSLDNLIGAFSVTMIKMDLEGHELNALAGAEAVIRRQQPLLAVSCYHRLEHYWQIPLWIDGLKLNYAFRLLHHSRSYDGTVCYAVPRAEGR